MATRPIWKGHITFGLVNIPVVLYPAEKTTDVQFKLLDKRDKSRIRYVRINEHTGKEVPWNAVAKGFAYDHKDYILLTDEEIKSLLGENTKTIQIENFVPKSELDFMDFDKPYYLVPDKKGEKGYVILREILEKTKKVGITRVMIHTRQYLAALLEYENILILNLMRYHQNIKKPSEFNLPSKSHSEHRISGQEMIIAKKLVDSMTVPWNPKNFVDEFKKTLHLLIQKKLRQSKSKKAKPARTVKKASRRNNIIDFVEVLKKSLKESQSSKRSKRANR